MILERELNATSDSNYYTVCYLGAHTCTHTNFLLLPSQNTEWDTIRDLLTHCSVAEIELDHKGPVTYNKALSTEKAEV